MNKALFKVGDIVRHKTSCEQGVVVSINGDKRCKKHPGLMTSLQYHITGGSDDCDWVTEFRGTYDLSIGFGNTAEDIPEGLLVLDGEV